MDPGNNVQFSTWVNMPLFYIGETPVTFGGLGSAAFIFIASLIVSAFIQRAIGGRLVSRFKVSSGIDYTIKRCMHYTIVFFGVILAAQCVGLNIGSLAIVFGFLSVGIGFGLQNITSNFVSGLILLLERPICVGDLVSVGEQVGTVTHIKMRATLIKTLDNVSMIVPNSKFIENDVANWSHDDPRIRLHCPVGVAYGSDVAKVKEALLRVAGAHPDVLKEPAPEVRFLEFGDSSLDFDLLVWIDKPSKQFVVRSQINFAIDAEFRKENVQIPFPQRDVHLQLTPAVERLASGSAR